MTSTTGPAARVLPARRGRRNVYVHLDIPYRRVDGMQLRLHIIQVSGDGVMEGWEAAFSERYPCLLFVQGSGWQEQALGTAMAPLCRFAERGFVIAIVEYRPASVAVHPAQVEDAAAALTWLDEHAEQFGIDREHLFVAGDSSGGHTALMLHASEGLTESRPPLRGAVALYAPSDLAAMTADENVRAALGSATEEEAARAAGAADPLALVTADRALPPLLLVHGTADDVVPARQSRRYARALRERGQDVELVLVEGGGHGVWPSFYTPELGDVVEEFLRRERSLTPPAAAGPARR